MGEKTSISWCDHTFNPWWGCQEVSPACDDCYARRDAHRYYPTHRLWGPNSNRRTFGEEHWRQPLRWAKRARADGVRRRVFCASMADVFDNALPQLQSERERLWALIEATPELDWLLLTKRVGNVMGMVPERWYEHGWPRNVWLGISVVTQAEADRDIPKQARIPAAVRFLSDEPLLEGISYTQIATVAGQESCCNGRRDEECAWCGGSGIRNKPSFDWVICGGESGPRARPMHVNWARGLRDECATVNVPFFFKQWGEWICRDQIAPDTDVSNKLAAYWNGGGWDLLDDSLLSRLTPEVTDCIHFKMGRAFAPDWLDGRQHLNFPETRP